jgi:hypothetical protein
VTGTHRAGKAVTHSLGALCLAAGDHVWSRWYETVSA